MIGVLPKTRYETRIVVKYKPSVRGGLECTSDISLFATELAGNRIAVALVDRKCVAFVIRQPLRQSSITRNRKGRIGE